MLKVRIIPTLLIRDVNLVKGPAFDSWRAVGSPMQSVKVFNRRDVDELIILDIGATPNTRGPDIDMISTLARECFVPLTVGGGVRDIDTVRTLLLAGADKVAINSAAYEDPGLIRKASEQFGVQCVVAGIDYRTHQSGVQECFSHGGARGTGLSPIEWAKELEQNGAGEILLTSIERDAMMTGYDLEMIEDLSAAVSIPVIANGGAGEYAHLEQAILAGACAVSAASIFLFTQMTPLEAKAYLADNGIAVRKHLQD